MGLGSNLGDRRGHLQAAVAELLACGRVARVSSLYETEPVGMRGQGPFLNAVACVETELEAEEFLKRLLAIEERHGRVRRARYGPRTLDLDLLLWGPALVRTATLVAPHPRMHERRFVLEPLCEVAPRLVHPALGRTVAELLAGLADPAGVRKVAPGPEWARQSSGRDEEDGGLGFG